MYPREARRRAYTPPREARRRAYTPPGRLGGAIYPPGKLGEGLYTHPGTYGECTAGYIPSRIPLVGAPHPARPRRSHRVVGTSGRCVCHFVTFDGLLGLSSGVILGYSTSEEKRLEHQERCLRGCF